MTEQTAKRYCLCGSTAIASSNLRSFAEGVIELFDQFHQGDGHGPATPAQARAARRRADRDAAAEVSRG